MVKDIDGGKKVINHPVTDESEQPRPFSHITEECRPFLLHSLSFNNKSVLEEGGRDYYSGTWVK